MWYETVEIFLGKILQEENFFFFFIYICVCDRGANRKFPDKLNFPDQPLPQALSALALLMLGIHLPDTGLVQRLATEK